MGPLRVSEPNGVDMAEPAVTLQRDAIGARSAGRSMVGGRRAHVCNLGPGWKETRVGLQPEPGVMSSQNSPRIRKIARRQT